MELQRDKILLLQREKDAEKRRWHEHAKLLVSRPATSNESPSLSVSTLAEMTSSHSDGANSGALMHYVRLSKGARTLGMTITSAESLLDGAESGVLQVASHCLPKQL